jgi:hypothetical protein
MLFSYTVRGALFRVMLAPGQQGSLVLRAPLASLAADLQSYAADCEAPSTLGPPLDYDASILHARDFGHLGRATAIRRAGYVRANPELARCQFEGADNGFIVAHRPGVSYAPKPAEYHDIAACHDLGTWVQIAD